MATLTSVSAGRPRAGVRAGGHRWSAHRRHHESAARVVAAARTHDAGKNECARGAHARERPRLSLATGDMFVTADGDWVGADLFAIGAAGSAKQWQEKGKR